MIKLANRHRTFVEAYDGDEVFAMKSAGYTGNDSYLRSKAKELLALPLIQEAIKDRSKYLTNIRATIATREERQQFWTDVMQNIDPHRREEEDANGVPIKEGNIPLATRLKASELLGKSQTDFVEKIDMTTTVTLSDIILKSYAKEETHSLEDIEAEYYRLKEEKQLPDMVTPDPLETLDDLV